MSSLSLVLMFLQMLIPGDAPETHSSVGVSISRPSNPNYFFDYWKLGYGISYQRSSMPAESYGWLLLGDANWFPLDQTRLFQRFGVDPDQTKMTGGSAVTLSFSANMNYRVPGYTETVPYVFGGFGVSFSDILGSTITYPFNTTEKGMQTGIGFIFPVGMYVETKYRGTTDIVIMLKHNFGIPVSKNSLSGNTALTIGFRLD